MTDPRQVKKGGFSAFAALDHEQRLVREAIADATPPATRATPEPSAAITPASPPAPAPES